MPQSQIKPVPSVKLSLVRFFFSFLAVDALHFLHTDADVWMFRMLKPSNLVCVDIRVVGNDSIMQQT